ncbi:MAG: methionine--tRNA ligase [Planctomycetota bacterium]
MSENLIVTSALPYANGPIHFGHIAGAYLPADVFVRFRRMRGDFVHFVCGTDEHGVAITLKAEQAGADYASYVDRWHGEIAATMARFSIEFDVFSGTAHHRNPFHRELAQQFFTDLLANGWLGVREETQYYSEASNRFLPDRYIQGSCYLCGFEKARGDECPNCGKFLDAKRLGNPRSTIDGSEPVLRATKHWYLDLGRARDEWLRAWFEGKRATWKPNVVNFVLGDLDELRERPITRDLPWGVPVPLPDTAGKVLYVWFDAPIGYLSISRQHFHARGEPERFEQLWRDPATKLFHFIGKDNITFHSVIFPAMLHGTGRGWVLPENVPANEFFNLEGRKFNTSSGWFIENESVADIPTDVLRWAICSMMPETADSEWTWTEFQARVNGDLADNLGNFVSRTLRFLERFFDGDIPAEGSATEADHALRAVTTALAAEVIEHLTALRFRRALGAILAVGAECNRYYDAQAPWTLVKDKVEQPSGRQRAATILRTCCDSIELLAALVAPVMPNSSRAMRTALGLTGEAKLDGDRVRLELPSAGVKSPPLTAALPKQRDERGEERSVLFQKIPDSRIEAERARLLARGSTPPAAPTTKAPSSTQTTPTTTLEPTHDPLAATIEFDTFSAVDLRAGTIVAAERHQKADRLLVLRVSLGFETRTIVAGIASAYEPAELIGKRVVAVANLAPRALRGVESQGMLLATDGPDGKPRLVSPGEGAPDGQRVK